MADRCLSCVLLQQHRCKGTRGIFSWMHRGPLRSRTPLETDDAEMFKFLNQNILFPA